MDPQHIYERRVDPDAEDSLAKLLRLVRPASTILELGPATGYFTRYLVEQLGCTVDCVEYSAEAAERASRWAREMWVADLDRIDLTSRFAAGAYDYVVAADVLEHLSNPWRVAAACRTLLAPDGHLLLSIPNVGHAALVAALMEGRFEYDEEGLLDRTHLRFFTRPGLLEMVRGAGFRVASLGAVTVMADDTEFRRSLELLAPALREHLLANPDALTYQFIVDAVPGEMEDEAWSRLERSGEVAPLVFATRLYWARDGEDHVEERSLARLVPVGAERQRVRFDLPAGARFSSLRFDPADRPGFLRLYSVVVARREAGAAAREWRYDSPGLIAEGLERRNLEYSHSALGDAFLAATADPELVFRLDEEVSAGDGVEWTLEAELSWPMSADFVVLNESIAAEKARLEVEVRGLTSERDEQVDRIHELIQNAKQLDVVKGRFEQIEAEYLHGQAEFRKLDRKMARLEEEYDRLGKEYRAVHDGYARLEGEYATAEREREALARERERAEARLTELRVREAKAQRELAEQRELLVRRERAAEAALGRMHGAVLREREEAEASAVEAARQKPRLRLPFGASAASDSARQKPPLDGNVDTPPAGALVLDASVGVAGWAIGPPGRPVVAVRARMGDGQWQPLELGTERPDVAAAYAGREGAERPGFHGLVSLDAVRGRVGLEVEVELHGGDRHTLDRRTLYVERLDEVERADPVRWSLDAPPLDAPVTGAHVKVGGWAVGPPEDAISVVRCRVGGGEWVELEPVEREDIFELMGRREGTERSGFLGLVEIERLPSGWASLELEVELASGARYALAPRFVDVARPDAPVLAGSLDEPAPGALCSDERLAIGGWVVAGGDDPAVAVRARVAGGDWSEVEHGIERADLAALMPKREGAGRAGFSGFVSLERTPAGRQLLEVDVELASGARHPLASRIVYILPMRRPASEDDRSPRRRAERAVLRVGVDVVVPIFNARDDVRRCVESVLRHVRGDWRLVLVDDASTDAELVAWLDELAQREPRVVLTRNETNSGFVVTANRGMRQASGRDVILLNSDTIVTSGFVEKLMACVHSDRDTGIATPFTNNGTICSIPEFCRDNPLPEEIALDDYAALVERASLRAYPEIVTAVGFCMYIRAEVLDAVGYFDEESFGRGYGEENDFCERAKKAGYTVRLCDDVFVAHLGKASFGDEGRSLERTNQAVLEAKHPQYAPAVQEFCATNPLAKYQANVAYHMRRREARAYPALAFLLHMPLFGAARGGTEYHVADLVAHLAAPRAVVIYPEVGDIVVFEVFDGKLDEAVAHRIPRDAKYEQFELRSVGTEMQLARILSWFDVGAAHIHHLLNWPLRAWRVLDARAIPFVYTAHDYYCACPSWNLLDHSRVERCACSGASEADRERCLLAKFAQAGAEPPDDVEAYRREHRAELVAMLERSRAAIVPSAAARDAIAAQYEGRELPLHVVPHGYEAEAATSPGTAAGEPLRVALLGAVAATWKGADHYIDVIERLAGAPVEWHVFGVADAFGFLERLEAAAPPGRLRVHGQYRRRDVPRLLAENAVDVTLLLSPWDETFCYTLSESWLASIPAVVSDHGAPAERVRATGAGVVVANAREAAEALARLAADRDALAGLRARAGAVEHGLLSANARRHREVYGPIWDIVTRRREPGELGVADAELSEAAWRARDDRGRLVE